MFVQAMSLEVTRLVKPKPADIATIWFFTSVHKSVSLQVGHPDKRFVAILARIPGWIRRRRQHLEYRERFIETG
jgi:hypothetical protein